MLQIFRRRNLSAYLTNQDDADDWQLVLDHYAEPDRSASSILVQLVREKALAIRTGKTKRQQLQRIEQLLTAIAEKLEISV